MVRPSRSKAGRGVYPPPPTREVYGQITCWGKKILEGDEKKGKLPQLVKSMHIIPQLTQQLQNCKQNFFYQFSPEARTPSL